MGRRIGTLVSGFGSPRTNRTLGTFTLLPFFISFGAAEMFLVKR